MLTLLLLAGSAFGSPEDATIWEARLRTWFDQSFEPDARRRWSRAAPTQVYAYLENVRWGPDSLVAPLSCAEFLAQFHGDITMKDNGYQESDLIAAKAALGSGWAAAPTGFDGWRATGAFRRSPANSRFDSPHLTVKVTQLPAGLDPERLFEAGIANGCGVAKTSFAFAWSADTLVCLDSPCAEESRFAAWTLLVLDALPGWTGAPVSQRLVYGRCGTVGIHFGTRVDVEREALR